MKVFYLTAVLFLITVSAYSQTDGVNKNSSPFKIARLKYSGGGDWYNDP